MKKNKKVINIVSTFIVALITISVLSLVFLISDTKNQLISGDIDQASINSKTALVIFKPISNLTFERNSNIELAKNSLELITLLPETINEVSNLVKLENEQNYIFDLNQLLPTTKRFSEKVLVITKLLEKSNLAQRLIGSKKYQEVILASIALEDFVTVLEELVAEPQKWIVIFQNSDELRATGGFMGSYAIVDINQGKIIDITVEDIYDADGQFKGYVEPPKGVAKYLSSSRGLRLPDSNWDPDFRNSSRQILQFFALGNKQNVKGIVAVNLDFAKIILDIVGEVEIVDYNTIVDKNNINQVLRSRRDDFFPGSNQKKHLLSQLLTQVQIKLASLDNDKKIELINSTTKQTKINNIQFYSSNPKVDEIFSSQQMRKEVGTKENADYLYLVESNVGVNKANRNISRTVSVINTDNQRTVSVAFKNSNLIPSKSKLSELVDTDIKDIRDNHLGYINYQRIIVPQDWELESILYNQLPITDWNTKEYQTDFETLKEIGFLVTLEEKLESKLNILFIDNSPDDKKIFIQKQPGIDKTSYTISKGNNFIEYLLESDLLINYP